MERGFRGDRLVADGGDGFVIECRTDESITRAVVRGIAAIKGVAETDLNPLYQSIEVEALETILQHAEENGNDVSVEFAIAEYRVNVHCNNRMSVREDLSQPLSNDDRQ